MKTADKRIKIRKDRDLPYSAPLCLVLLLLAGILVKIGAAIQLVHVAH